MAPVHVFSCSSDRPTNIANLRACQAILNGSILLHRGGRNDGGSRDREEVGIPPIRNSPCRSTHVGTGHRLFARRSHPVNHHTEDKLSISSPCDGRYGRFVQPVAAIAIFERLGGVISRLDSISFCAFRPTLIDPSLLRVHWVPLYVHPASNLSPAGFRLVCGPKKARTWAKITRSRSSLGLTRGTTTGRHIPSISSTGPSSFLERRPSCCANDALAGILSLVRVGNRECIHFGESIASKLIFFPLV